MVSSGGSASAFFPQPLDQSVSADSKDAAHAAHAGAFLVSLEHLLFECFRMGASVGVKTEHTTAGLAAITLVASSCFAKTHNRSA